MAAKLYKTGPRRVSGGEAGGTLAAPHAVYTHNLMRKTLVRSAFFSVVLVLFVPLLADIGYVVKIEAEAKQLKISVEIPAVGNTTEVQIPNWAPGAYILRDYRESIKDLSATADNGEALTVERPDENTWRIANGNAKVVKVSYTLPAQISDNITFYSGPPTYVYVVGRKAEACKLRVETPPGWRVACGLDEVGGHGGEFVAPDYDTLADNPVTAGIFQFDTYTVMGKPHYIVYRGPAVHDVDRMYVLRACKHITESQADFFGGLPYNKYVWHFSVNDGLDGGGGLEHLSSTQITMASGVGPGVVGVMSHEFFHLWNVKRIRSKPLGPFNYLELPKTGALWWLEGVTDYYAHLLLFRYGWTDEKRFLDVLLNNVNGVRRNPARLEVSPYESSLRVGEANGGRGNSNGYKISYYSLGFVAGACLDIEIRSQSKGARSLDDVTRALFNMCKDGKPGFEEDAIRKLCVQFGGSSLGEFYDKLIMQAGEMPIETQLAKAGLEIRQVDETYVDVGFDWTASKEDKGARIRGVAGPAQGKLQNNDVIISLNGRSVEGSTVRAISSAMNEGLKEAKVGSAMRLKVRRGNDVTDVEVIPVVGVRKVQRIVEAADATEEMRALRRSWYFAGKRQSG